MRIVISNVTSQDVLAGSTEGAALLSKLVAQSASRQAEVIFLDFSGISVATGSFLREAVLGFREYCRRSGRGLIPVVANMNEVVREELCELLIRKSDALVVCDLDSSNRLLRARVLGLLEEKQRLALALVIQQGETDAPSLANSVREQERIGITGWNNRLAALATKGILAETRSGRVKRYRPVLENLEHGS